jgi:hypothetical protein
MRRRLLVHKVPSGMVLGRRDYLAAGGVFLLVVLATFPVVLPFMLTADIVLAVDVSGSMLSEDFTLGSQRVSRLDVVKASVPGVCMVLLVSR